MENCNFAKFKKFDDLTGVTLHTAIYGNHKFPLHIHSDYAVGVISKGVHEMETDKIKDFLDAGKIFSMNPNTLHTGTGFEQNGWVQTKLHFTKEFFKSIAEERELDVDTLYFSRMVNNRPDLAARMHSVFLSLFAGEETIEIESELVSLFDMLFEEGVINKGDVKNDNDGSVKNAVDMIHSSYSEKVSLEGLAKAANMSKFHFLRQFKKTYGQTPHSYITGVRIEQASKMLGQDKSLAEIALDNGFADQAHFTRIFKKYFGFTPSRILFQ